MYHPFTIFSISAEFFLFSITAEVLCRPSEYYFRTEIDQSRPRIDYRKLRKYSVGRWSTFSERRKTNLGQEKSSADCGSTLSAVGVLFPNEERPISAKKIHPQIAEILCRPLEYFFRFRRNVILAEVLAAWRELMVLKVGQDFLQLEEEALAGFVTIGIHVESGGKLRVEG